MKEEQGNAVEDAKKATKDDTVVQRKYVISRIVHLLDAPQGRKYVVICYRCGPGDETLEQAHHILPTSSDNIGIDNQQTPRHKVQLSRKSATQLLNLTLRRGEVTTKLSGF